MKKSKANSKGYTWGSRCKGWHLVASDTLSVITEEMPPNSREVAHYHSNAQQFFYVLKGMATFALEADEIAVGAGEGIHIHPKTVHAIRNDEATQLEFLVISQPSSRGDRTEIV